MIRQRISTSITTLSLLLSLTVVSVALPASTLAAIPNVHAGRGTVDQLLATGAQPATVSPGAYVQFSTWAKNYDSSTVSQFFLTETYGRTIQSATWSGSNGSGSCATTVPLNCSFGQLKPGQYVNAVIVLQALPDGTSMPVNFVWSTVGIGHGDSFPVTDSVGLNASGDFSGRYLIGSDLLPIGDADVLSSTNQQSTIVYSPTTGIGVTVEDGSGVTSACVPVSKCFGQTSDIHVGNGSAQYGQFKVIISLHSSEIPKGVNANNLIVYHDGVAITTLCADAPVADCYSVAKFKWGLQVTIWVLHNGKFNIG